VNVDLAAQAVALNQAQTRQSAEIAVIKKAHEMQMDLVEMVDNVTRRAALPEGQGSVVDRTA